MVFQRLKQFIFILLSLALVAFGLAACGEEEGAKEPGFPSTEYVSSTDLFSLYVPTGWRAEEVIPGADLAMANNERALESYHNGGAIESGDFLLNVGFLPQALLQEQELSHLGFQLDASPEVFLGSLLPMFRIGEEPAGNVAGEATLVSLRDGRDAGMLAFSDEGREGLVLVFEAGDGVFAFVSAAGFPGEMHEFQEVTYAVAAEVAYHGSQDALYSVLYGD
jgi:hypothetical protein